MRLDLVNASASESGCDGCAPSGASGGHSRARSSSPCHWILCHYASVLRALVFVLREGCPAVKGKSVERIFIIELLLTIESSSSSN